MNIPAIVFEGGESVRLDGLSIENGLKGMRRVMSALHMTDEKQIGTQKSIYIPKSSWIRASQSGMFIWSKSSGSKVVKGEPLGVINDPFGTKSVTVLSKYNGYIIGHNNGSVVNQGDALYNIGLEK